MRFALLLALLAFVAGPLARTALAQADPLGLGPFADSLEVRGDIPVRSTWPRGGRHGEVQRLTRVRHLPSSSPETAVTVAEYERGAKVQVTVVGDDLGRRDPPPPIRVGGDYVRGRMAATHTAEALPRGVARGAQALREATQRIRPFVAIGTGGVVFAVEVWDREGGAREWWAASPGHGTAHDEVAELVTGVIGAAFVELGIYAREGDPYPFGNLRAGVQSAHRRLFGAAPDSLTAESSHRLVGALADRALVAAATYPSAFSTAPVDTLFALALQSLRGAFYNEVRPPPEAAADTVRRYLALGAAPGAIVQLRTGGPLAPLDRVADLEAMRLLLAAGANPDGAGVRATPLGYAAWLGDLDRVRLLLSAGADPNGADYGGNPSLVAAALRSPGPSVSDADAEAQLRAVMDALLDAGAAPDARGGWGQTAYHVLRSQSRYPALAEHLIARGADPNPRDFRGRTPQESRAEAEALVERNRRMEAERAPE